MIHSHQTRPWCRHAGTPPPAWDGVLARRQGPPTQFRGLGKPLTWRCSPGCSHSASRSSSAPCMQPGRTGIGHRRPGSSSQPRAGPGTRTGGASAEPARRPALSQLARPRWRLQDRGQGDLCMVQRRLISGPGPFLSTTAPGNPVAVRHICNQDF